MKFNKVSVTFIVAICLLVFFSGYSPLFGQFTTASLGGTVRDSSGAAIPDAAVKIQSTQTGASQSQQTNQDGGFIFTALQVGSYELHVEKTGFAGYDQKGITLTVNQAATQIVTLNVGSVSKVVTVTSDASIISTHDATAGQLVDQKKIVDLPLNGREVQSLLYLAPGAVDTTARYCGYNCFGGVYPGEQQAAVNGTGPGMVSYQLDGGDYNDTYLNMNLPFPNPDAIQEFNLDSTNLSAQYGGSAGGVVNIVTRSGTNQIHGDLFEFVRNGAVNAKNYFASSPDPLKRNQFGGAVGGPIVKNKLFYFGSYQGTRTRDAAGGQIGYVPTAAERTGDFSDLLPKTQLKDPVTGAPYPRNRLPSINPVTTKLLAYIPLPNGPGRQLTYIGPATVQNDNQYLAKINYDLGKHRISGHYFDTHFTQTPFKVTNNILAADPNGADVHIRDVAANDTYIAKPTLLFNTWYGWNSQIGGTIPSAAFGWPDLGVKIAQPPGIPPESYISIGGAFTANTNWKGQFDRGDYNVREDVTVLAGQHELHFGGEYLRLQRNFVNSYAMGGFFFFTGSLTGDNLADLILGSVTTFNQGGGSYTQIHGNRFAAYAQDNWKVSSRLAVTAGLRWEPYFPYQQANGKVVCYIPGEQSLRFKNAPVGLVYGGSNHDPGCPSGGAYQRLWNFAPRLGFAYQVTGDGKTVVRAGTGFYYAQLSSDSLVMEGNAPFAPSERLSGVTFDDPYGSAGVVNPFPAQYGYNAPSPDSPFHTPVQITDFLPLHLHLPLVTTWNIALERQIASDFKLRVAYLGVKGTNMGPSTPYLNTQELNPAIYIPGHSSESNTQARRLNPQFSSITMLPTGLRTNYNALQVALDKRLSHGLTVIANYTWSRTIDDYGWDDPFNKNFSRGLSSDDVPHVFRFAAVYALPPTPLRGIAGRFVNGWEISANTSWQAGFPFSVTSGVDNSFSGVGRDHADFLGGNPRLSQGRPHSQLIAKWFDTSKFTTNALGTFGDTGKNTLRGPRSFGTDAALLKNLPIAGRVGAQFRFEFFNLFNNVNFGNPNATVTSGQAFGQITSAADPRILQGAIKLTF